jgi:histidinol-phosphatase (PHP family)
LATSYHCHSRWSDGEGEIADFVDQAKAIGLGELGLSDHYVLTPDRSPKNWAMPIDALGDYVAAVQAAAEESGPDLIVRLGVEADHIPETAGELKDLLAEYPFDYVIGSVHAVDGFPIDSTPQDWEGISRPERDEIIRGYWVRVREMAQTGTFDFAGHLDLTKKFGFHSSVDTSGEISSALDAIGQSGMAVELNTSGWHVAAGEAYPSRGILRGCFERGIPALVTADAHKPQNLLRDFDRGYSLLREVGFRDVCTFVARRRSMRAL